MCVVAPLPIHLTSSHNMSVNTGSYVKHYPKKTTTPLPIRIHHTQDLNAGDQYSILQMRLVFYTVLLALLGTAAVIPVLADVGEGWRYSYVTHSAPKEGLSQAQHRWKLSGFSRTGVYV